MDDLQHETLAGDVRDVMLEWIRDLKSPWSLMSEDKQRAVVSSVQVAAHDLVARATAIIAARGFDSATVLLKELKIKDAIEGKIVAANESFYRDRLGERVGSPALIVFADPEDFAGQKADAEVDPDQRSLPGTEA
ncbi:MAG: metallopeptidase TldD-related protein [Pseudomonadota bacterium]